MHFQFFNFQFSITPSVIVVVSPRIVGSQSRIVAQRIVRSPNGVSLFLILHELRILVLLAIDGLAVLHEWIRHSLYLRYHIDDGGAYRC